MSVSVSFLSFLVTMRILEDGTDIGIAEGSDGGAARQSQRSDGSLHVG